MFGIAILTIIISFIQKMTYPQWPFISGDPYITLTLNNIKDPTMFQGSDRELGYQYFLLILVKLFGSFKAITIAQHILAQLTGLLLYITFIKSIFATIKSKNIFFVISTFLTGYLTMFAYIFSISVFSYSVIIQPEILCNFLAMTYIFLLSIIMLNKNDTHNKSVLLLFTLNSILLPLTKGAYLFTPLLSLWVISHAKLYKNQLLPKIALMLPYLFICISFLPLGQNSTHENYLVKHLFASNGLAIYQTICDDIAKNKFSNDKELVFYKAMKIQFEKAFQCPKIYFTTLGFNINAILYPGYDPTQNTFVINTISQYFDDNNTAINNFEWNYTTKSILYHPSNYIIKALKQLSIVYTDWFTQRKIIFFPNDLKVGLDNVKPDIFIIGTLFTSNFLINDTKIQKNPSSLAWERGIKSWETIEPTKILKPINITFIYKIFEFLRIFTIYGLLGISLINNLNILRTNEDMNNGIRLGIAILLVGFLINLIYALFHTLEIERYLFLQLATNLFTTAYLTYIEIHYVSLLRRHLKAS